MPRELHPELRDMIERPNPYTEYRIEIAEPDVGQVLRREDQFLRLTTASPPGSLVSMTPALSLSASPRGSLVLTGTDVPLVSFTGTGGYYDLNANDVSGQTRYKGMQWTLDPAFSRARVTSFNAKVQAIPVGGFFYFDQAFDLQIFQIAQMPGAKVANVGQPNYSSTAFTNYVFMPLLSPAPAIRVTKAQWISNAVQTLPFDLSNFWSIVENVPTKAIAPDQTGLLNKLLFCVRLAATPFGGLGGSSNFRWLTDTVASHVVTDVGRFDRVFWGRADENSQWSGDPPFSDIPNCSF